MLHDNLLQLQPLACYGLTTWFYHHTHTTTTTSTAIITRLPTTMDVPLVPEEDLPSRMLNDLTLERYWSNVVLPQLRPSSHSLGEKVVRVLVGVTVPLALVGLGVILEALSWRWGDLVLEMQ
jgi:hypothetical protein